MTRILGAASEAGARIVSETGRGAVALRGIVAKVQGELAELQHELDALLAAMSSTGVESMAEGSGSD